MCPQLLPGPEGVLPIPDEAERFGFDVAVLKTFEEVQGAATHALLGLLEAGWNVSKYVNRYEDASSMAAELRDYHSLLVWDIKRAGRIAAQFAALEDQAPLLRIMRAVPFGQKPGARA